MNVKQGVSSPSNTEVKECPGCGMQQDEWGTPKGFLNQDEDEVYCCEGCANFDECTCS